MNFIFSFSSSPYVLFAIVNFSIQWIFWIISSCLKTEKFYDLVGSITFIYVIWHTLFWKEELYLRQYIQTIFITIWALRLGFYLFTRVLRESGDSRFNNMRNKPRMLFFLWTMQGLWVYITLLPTMILNFSENKSDLYWRDYVGWALWLIGFCIEAIADYQKSKFRRNPLNHKKFLTSGLWNMCRYPHYFGEIVLWFGLFICASSIMSEFQYVSILSPIFIAFLLICVSGIKIQEKQAQERWATDTAYLAYKQKTAKLIPWIW